ncbi:MAG: hypothetical protein R2910_12925 [Gemmatimonadales bacterium]
MSVLTACVMASPVKAQQHMVDRLSVRVRSGADDLRKGSKLRVWLLLRNGDVLNRSPVPSKKISAPLPLNCRTDGYCATVPSYTSRSYELVLDRQVPRSEIDRVVLSFQGGKESVFDSPDNWDLAELEVRARVRQPDGRQEMVTLVRLNGSPLYRFRDNESHEWPVTRATVRP